MAQMIEMNLRPDAKTLRQFGFIAIAGFGFVAAIAHFEVLIFAMGLGAAKPYVVGTFAGLAVYPNLGRSRIHQRRLAEPGQLRR